MTPELKCLKLRRTFVYNLLIRVEIYSGQIVVFQERSRLHVTLCLFGQYYCTNIFTTQMQATIFHSF